MFSFFSVLSKVTVRSLVLTFLVFIGLGVTPMRSQTAPVLVPYSITAIAGNTQSSVPGYGGDGVLGLNATLNGPNALAVDSVGNVYIADQSNALIREWNAQTGILKTIAGMPPSKCTGTTCTTTNPGCADGVPAVGNQVGSRMQGLVVDGYGNVYYSDYNYQGVWVIYKGGAQVANFITLVDSSGVTAAGGVLPGYVYHIAGTAVPKAGGGCSGTSGAANKSTGTDNVLATKALFHDPLQMGIDAAGNLYVQDYANSVVRVINTQATAQTFFGVSVQPGFVAAVVGCNATATSACPSSTPAFGGPAGAALFSNQLAGMTTDRYGNVYELDTKGATGSIYGGVAYAGGAALAKLITLESGLTAMAGSWYEVINSITSANGPTTAVQAVPANGSNDIVLRPSSIAVDPLGNLYMMDYHWISIYRIDVNSQMATRINGLSAAAGTTAAPAYCSGTTGPQTTDAYGDGCPLQQAKFNSAGTGYVTFDGAGNLYVTDTGNNIVRKVSLGTQFPSTALGSALTQTLQMHFDASNLPASTDTASFGIVSGSADFAVSAVSCSNYTLGLDASTECYVNVTFTPVAGGARAATLQATTANGSVYSFPLTGFASGPQIAIDGGASSALTLAGLASTAGVAVDATGRVYVADPTGNQVVVSPALGSATTVGKGLSNPQGVAVDPAGNVYISDSGNGRIVEVSATGVQTTLTTNVLKPQGLAVDTMGNVYVADTGNARVVEIPAFGELAASPLLAYSGAQALITPTAVAVDRSGNVYVADSGNPSGLIKIAAGGGDLQPNGTSLAPPATIVGFGTGFVKAPSGVAVDGGGNLYVTDSTNNNVQVIPAGSGPGSDAFTVNFSGLGSPTGLALDASNNLYVVDAGNKRVVVANRSNPTVNFGLVAQFQSPAATPLTVTNVGTGSLTPTVPFAQLSGATANFSESDTCGAANFPLGTLNAGLHCTMAVSFDPQTDGPLAATASVQGGQAKVSLIGTGEEKLVTITMAVTSPASGPMMYQPAVVTLTATQPGAANVPSGTVTFNYTINGVAQPPVTQTLTQSGSKATATLSFSNLLPARVYVINAKYNGDAYDSPTPATFTFTCPGFPVTAVSSSASYTYGGTVPALSGTVSGIAPADQAAITVTFTSGATASSPVGTYPITAVLSGGNAANYSVAPAVTATGAPAIVTENKAPLSIVVGNTTVPYGAPNQTYPVTKTGLVNGDVPTITFTPAQSQLQPVGTYPVVPTVTIPGNGYDKINNYNASITNGTLTVTQAVSALTPTQANTAVLPTALSSGAISIRVAPPQAPTYGGTPTGKVTLQEVFTPLTSSGSGTPVTEPSVVLTLAGGAATYTPTDPTLGVHVYSFFYSGDSNFLATDTSAAPTTLIVDQADFTISSTTSPVQVAPGIVPGGNAALAGEQAATPETATVYIGDILGSTQMINLTCAVPVAYMTCTLSPTSVTLTGKTTLTSVVSISVPATLPADYKASVVRRSGPVVFFAAIPLTLLGLLPFAATRRRRFSHLLLLLLAVGLLVGVSGCGSNQVQFFTPVPAGPTQVVITGTSGSITRTFTVPVDVQ